MRTGPSARTLALAGVAGVAAATVVATGALDALDLAARDAMLRLGSHRPATHVAAVVIDEAALATQGPWPWPRQRLAALLTAVRRAGARGAVLDILLLDRRPGEGALAEAASAFPTVLVATLDERGDGWLRPAPDLRAAGRLAHGVFELDRDGVLRRVMSTKQAAGEALPAVALAAARIARPELAVPVGRLLLPGFRTPPDTVPAVSAASVLAGAPIPLLAGRVVFVGLAAAGLGDRVVIPVSPGPRPDPGVLVQASVTESVLAGDLLRPLQPALAGIAAALLALAVTACSNLGGGRRLAGEAALLLAPAAAALAALRLGHVAVPAATLTALVLVAVLATEGWHSLLAWRHAGTAAALLAAAAGEQTAHAAGSLGDQLELVERLATEAARQRLANEESRRVVAHELKTPLTSVRGLSQLLRDIDLPPEERRRAAALLVAEADRLQAMIEHVMELERLPRLAFADAAADLDLSALVAERAEVLASGFRREVHREVAADLVVRGDRRLLERVLDNLIGNAFKFSPAETAVAVRARRQGGDAVVEVRDEGCGIPPEELEAIFRRFSRGAGARGREGLGLGLALVREVITWHRGRVTVDSAPGAGSTFTVTLPAA